MREACRQRRCQIGRAGERTVTGTKRGWGRDTEAVRCRDRDRLPGEVELSAYLTFLALWSDPQCWKRQKEKVLASGMQGTLETIQS